MAVVEVDHNLEKMEAEVEMVELVEMREGLQVKKVGGRLGVEVEVEVENLIQLNLNVKTKEVVEVEGVVGKLY